MDTLMRSWKEVKKKCLFGFFLEQCYAKQVSELYPHCPPFWIDDFELAQGYQSTAHNLQLACLWKRVMRRKQQLHNFHKETRAWRRCWAERATWHCGSPHAIWNPEAASLFRSVSSRDMLLPVDHISVKPSSLAANWKQRIPPQVNRQQWPLGGFSPLTMKLDHINYQ